MTQQEKNEIKEMLHNCMAGVTARVEANHDILSSKVDGINERLDKINGRVYKIEGVQNDRTAILQEFKDFKEDVCPKLHKIEKLEQSVLENALTKKFVVKALLIALTLPAVLWAIIQILEKVI